MNFKALDPRGLRRLASRAVDALSSVGRAYRAGGAREAKSFVARAAYWRLHPRVRRWGPELARQYALDRAFDEAHGVETAGQELLADVGIAGPDVERGHGRYRPVWAFVFAEAIEHVPGDLSRFTFVDYGSGKGKAMLLASDYPFHAIIGIEFAKPLHDVAARNLERYSSPTQRCHDLRSENVDALTFDPPAGPLVCFFFNPFDAHTFGAVVDRLRESARRSPREIVLVYTNMRDVRENRELFVDRPELMLLAQNPRYLVYFLRAT